MEHRQWLVELAAKIADGQQIDWQATDALAKNDQEREMLTRLQSIERLTQAQALGPAVGAGIPTSWGALQIVEKVGHGTSGDVYRAWDPRLDRHVALKILRQPHDSKPGTTGAVIEEARMMARVRHPNIVAIHGADHIEGRTGIWMEFVEGRTLDEELRDSGPFSADQIRFVGSSICAALTAVHSAGLLHRDLKAQNVLRSTDGRILLADFGAGRTLTTDGKDPSSDLAGTPLYLAPEVLNGGSASVRSDLYSLGVLLCRLGTGAFPIAGRTLGEIRSAHSARNNGTTGPRTRRLPWSISRSIDRLLEVAPEARFADAQEAATALLRRPGKWMAALLTVGILSAVGASYFARTGNVREPAKPAELRMIEIPRAWDSSVSLGNPSPDGHWLICLSDIKTLRDRRGGFLSRCDPTRGWVEPIGAIPIRGQAVALSANGRFVAYVDETGKSLHVVGIDGLNDREVIGPARAGSGFAAFTISGDGSVVAAAVGYFPYSLFVVDHGEFRSLTNMSGLPPSLSLSPDGQWLAYAGSQTARGVELRVISTRSNQPHEIAGYPSSINSTPFWSTTGRQLYFTSDRTGRRSLWRISMIDGAAASAAELVEPLFGQRFLGTTGNDSAFFDRQIGEASTRIIGLPSESGAKPTSDSEIPDSAAEWSADGRLATLGIVESAQSRIPLLLIRDARGQEQERFFLAYPNLGAQRVRWSTDGHTLAICCARTAQGKQVWTLFDSVTSTTPHEIRTFGDPLFAPIDMAMTSDGGAAFYLPDPYSIRKTEFGSGRDVLVHGGQAQRRFMGDSLLLSRDGRLLGFTELSEKKIEIRIHNVTNGRTTTVATVPREQPGSTSPKVFLSGWTGSDRWLVLQLTSSDDVGTLVAVDTKTGATKQLITLPRGAERVRINAAGDRVAFTSRLTSRKELWTLDGRPSR